MYTALSILICLKLIDKNAKLINYEYRAGLTVA